MKGFISIFLAVALVITMTFAIGVSAQTEENSSVGEIIVTTADMNAEEWITTTGSKDEPYDAGVDTGTNKGKNTETVIVTHTVITDTVASIEEPETKPNDDFLEPEDYYTYEIVDGYAVITDVDTSISGDVVIPNILGDATVTEIGESAFYGCINITNITIPNSITSIGDAAFYGCSGLTDINIPDSVTEIGIHAFSNCTNIASITIPNSVTSIADYVFTGCTNLTSINIPDSVINIGFASFYGCSGLTSINIPDSVTGIAVSAFVGCSQLESINVSSDNTVYKSVDGILFTQDGSELLCHPSGKTVESYTIPNGVTKIGGYAFYGCSGLTNINISAGTTDIGNHAFSGCTELAEIIIPDSVINIGERAFYGCAELTEINIPNSVTNIGVGAFSNCSNITEISIPDSVTNIAVSAFVGCSRLESINVSGGNTVYKSIDGVLCTKDGLKLLVYPCGNPAETYTTPDGIKSIGDAAFSGCTNLTSVIISDGVTSIGNGAFIGCSELTSVTVPDSVTEILSNAFGNNEELILKANLGSYAEDYAYKNMIDFAPLNSAEIDPSGRFVYYIYKGCATIKDVKYEVASGDIVIPDTLGGVPVTAIDNEAFYSCNLITSIVIPEGVTEIGDYAFFNCYDIENITIPSSVTNIGTGAFSECNSLENITLPDSITEIKSYTFNGCVDLTNVYIPRNTISIDETAFNNSVNVVITGYSGSYAETYANENGIPFSALLQNQTEGGYTFDTTKNGAVITAADNTIIYAEDVVIPDTLGGAPVVGIGDEVFKRSSIINITLPDTVTSIGNSAFENSKSLESINIPDGMKTIGDEAFKNCSALKEILLPEGLEEIGGNIFYHCYSLSNIIIPKSVTAIGDSAFYGCYTITVYGYAGSYIETYAAENKVNFSVIEEKTENGITYEVSYGAEIIAADSAVAGDVIIPDTVGEVPVTSIAAGAFANCAGVTSITVPGSVTEIGEDAIPASITSLKGTSRSAAEFYAVANGIAYERTDGVVAGDVDGNGSCNITDATVVLKIIAKWEGINADESAADVNMDGVVTTVDVLNMLKYIAKWDGIYLF